MPVQSFSGVPGALRPSLKIRGQAKFSPGFYCDLGALYFRNPENKNLLKSIDFSPRNSVLKIRAATVNLGYSSQTDAFIAYFEECFQTSPISLVQFVFLFLHDSHE